MGDGLAAGGAMDQTREPAEGDEGEERPWEDPGVVRRDCEPHRAHLLSALSTFSLAVSVLSLLCLMPGVASLPLGLVTLQMARRDLEKMDRGRMDPNGAKQTATAREFARISVFLTLLGWPCWGLVIGMIAMMGSS